MRLTVEFFRIHQLEIDEAFDQVEEFGLLMIKDIRNEDWSDLNYELESDGDEDRTVIKFYCFDFSAMLEEFP